MPYKDPNDPRRRANMLAAQKRWAKRARAALVARKLCANPACQHDHPPVTKYRMCPGCRATIAANQQKRAAERVRICPGCGQPRLRLARKTGRCRHCTTQAANSARWGKRAAAGDGANA